jgi:hypothetical protein
MSSGISKLMSHPWFFAGLIIAFLVLSLIGGVIYQVATGFTKQITVKNTYTRLSGRKMWYMVADTSGALYRVGNLWWRADFNEADDWANLQAGKTYTVRGYGIRVPALSWYPTVYEFN